MSERSCHGATSRSTRGPGRGRPRIAPGCCRRCCSLAIVELRQFNVQATPLDYKPAVNHMVRPLANQESRGIVNVIALN